MMVNRGIPCGISPHGFSSSQLFCMDVKMKKKKFSKIKAVKSNARDRIGSPKPSRVLKDKKSKQEKFHKDWDADDSL
ncbi:Uncharacterised protein [uncultured archaeon]|nr:Uncharacterised protein [uncultured archaeon]